MTGNIKKWCCLMLLAVTVSACAKDRLVKRCDTDFTPINSTSQGRP